MVQAIQEIWILGPAVWLWANYLTSLGTLLTHLSISVFTWLHCTGFRPLQLYEALSHTSVHFILAITLRSDRGYYPHFIKLEIESQDLKNTLSAAARNRSGTEHSTSDSNQAFLTTSCCVIFLVPTVLKCHNLKNLCHHSQTMSLWNLTSFIHWGTTSMWVSALS